MKLVILLKKLQKKSNQKSLIKVFFSISRSRNTFKFWYQCWQFFIFIVHRLIFIRFGSNWINSYKLFNLYNKLEFPRNLSYLEIVIFILFPPVIDFLLWLGDEWPNIALVFDRFISDAIFDRLNKWINNKLYN